MTVQFCLSLGSPSPPLLHEVKLSGLVAGGPLVCRLCQEGKLVLLHEVKLSGLVAGGPLVCRLRQEGKLVLLHEVKLWGWCGIIEECLFRAKKSSSV